MSLTKHDSSLHWLKIHHEYMGSDNLEARVVYECLYKKHLLTLIKEGGQLWVDE